MDPVWFIDQLNDQKDLTGGGGGGNPPFLTVLTR